VRPRVWYLLVVAIVFASAAARSCAEFLRYGPYPEGEPYANLFLACAIAAGPALVLGAFRLLRRRQREAWPQVPLAAKITAVGLAAAGLCGAAVLWMALYAPLRWRIVPVAHALIAASAIGFIVACGGAVLTAVAAVRSARGRSLAS
jgi:hypothetical protein